ncbi:MAG TPA: pre-peptidase C-terminal domain-containing protein, partial [Gammaproteobacteria bacterium]|nr:pre-peptidase C-terminal domain-containing protein [Gammaproteobacteria bacterium]
TSALPPLKAGQYRVIVRPDIFNEVHEAQFEANNRTPSANVINVTVPTLQLGTPLEITLSDDQVRVYRVAVAEGETLRVRLTSDTADAANEVFVRYGDVPSPFQFDAAYQNPLQANQTAIVPTTQPGDYYILVRGHDEPQPNTPARLVVETVPLAITSVSADQGGDGRWVTLNVEGARFQPGALLKLVRPGVAELEPVRYEVLDSTRIKAIFDLRDAPHGLYDVKVINPNGESATEAYRYLIERAIEADVTVGLGGPRIVPAGSMGTFGVSLQSLTNVDTPYVHFVYGAPEMQENEYLFDLPFLTFSTNLAGAPDGLRPDVPWAALDSELNTTGQLLAPGYAFDVDAQGFVGVSFNVQTYPGLSELLNRQFEEFRLRLYAARPDLAAQGILDNGIQDLDKLEAGLAARFLGALPEIPDEEEALAIPFRFNVVAAATAMTRDEFIAQQTTEALRLRGRIISDEEAGAALQVLAADEEAWIAAYLAALEEAGLIRPVDAAPPVRQDPKVQSLMSVLATGILVGPAGSSYQTQASLVEFFANVRKWYGHDPDRMVEIAGYDVRTSDGATVSIPIPKLPEFADYDLGLTQRTHFQTFNVFAPFVGSGSTSSFDLPSVNATEELSPFEISRYLQEVAAQGRQASIIGPQAFGANQFLPTGYALPYTVRFANPETAVSSVGQVQVVVPLDGDLDHRSFRLASLKIGDINVNIPTTRAVFQGDFDFRNSKGFILRVSGGIDPQSATATWLIQAIDPETGEVIQDTTKGLLAPGETGSVSYTVAPKIDAPTGAKITATARILFNTLPPTDAVSIEQTLDAAAPTTTLTAEQLDGTDDYQVSWEAQDDAGGSGVRHVTVYVAKDGGDFEIWLSRTANSTGVFSGEAGHTYEFLALATDNAGNREQPPLGASAPDDGTEVNLGDLSTVATTRDSAAPPPAAGPATNPLFIAAQANVPANQPLTQLPEFDSVRAPFTLQSFATGFRNSGADVGALAVLELPDGDVLVSGGGNRGWIYRFGDDGGRADVAWAEFAEPIFNLALDGEGRLWATTGGGALLELDSFNGSVLGRHGGGITQAIAVHPTSGLLYLSSGDGIETFDPETGLFAHFSNVRVDDLQFSPAGELWGTSWPDRGTIFRFDAQGRATPMLAFDGKKVDSIAFGRDDTLLEGLLFVSTNLPDGQRQGATLELVELATRRQLTLATGGGRGEVLRTTADGRVLIAQTHQVDALSPIVAPTVAFSTPASGALMPLPLPAISVTFDQDMFAGSATTAGSVTNPASYALLAAGAEAVAIREVVYDAATRTATLLFDPLAAGDYQLLVRPGIKSTKNVALAQEYSASFTTLLNYSEQLLIEIADSRVDRANSTVSYDIRVTNTGDYDLVAPLTLVLDPSQYFAGS